MKRSALTPGPPPARRAPLTRRTALLRTTALSPTAVAPGVAFRWSLPVAVDPLWAPARKLALDRDEGRCRRCGRDAGPVHHRRARAMGGNLRDLSRHRPDILVSTCAPCHAEIHNWPEVARELGFTVNRPAQPFDVVLLTWQGPRILTAAGTVEVP